MSSSQERKVAQELCSLYKLPTKGIVARGVILILFISINALAGEKPALWANGEVVNAKREIDTGLQQNRQILSSQVRFLLCPKLLLRRMPRSSERTLWLGGVVGNKPLLLAEVLI